MRDARDLMTLVQHRERIGEPIELARALSVVATTGDDDDHDATASAATTPASTSPTSSPTAMT